MFQNFVQIISHHQEAARDLAQAGFIQQDGIISGIPQGKLPTKVMSLHAHHRHSGEGVVDRIQHLFG